MMKWMIVTAAMLSLACGASAETVPGEEPTATSRGLIEPSPPTPDDEPATPVPEDAPADVDTLRGLLSAHHAQDLPGADDLAAYETAEASLHWLTLHGDRMVIQVRALSLLQHFPTSETRELAVTQLDGSIPQLQAAAITALSGQNLEAAPELVDAIAGALRVDDVRIGLAALTVLSETPAGRQAISDACHDEAVPSRIRDAAMTFVETGLPAQK